MQDMGVRAEKTAVMATKMKAAEYEQFHEIREHTGTRFPYHTYLCRMPLDFQAVPVHWHEEVELIVIKRGSGFVMVDMERRKVEEGTIIIVPPGQLHAAKQDKDTLMEYESILFPVKMLAFSSADTCMEEYLIPFQNGEICFSPWVDGTENYHQHMKSYMAGIDSLCEKKTVAYQMGVRGFLCQFFALLFAHSKRKKPDKAKRAVVERMKRILEKIESSYSDNLTIQEMADLVGVSQPHFMKYFKQTMGIPFVQYLNEYRLLMAGRFLLVSQEEVLTIAMATGFDNISYFNRIFKKRFGMTPGEYRKRHITLLQQSAPLPDWEDRQSAGPS